MKTGVLGLGIIGSAWARNLHADGLLAACWNRSPKPDMPAFRKSPAEVADAADILIIVVADPPAVDSVLSDLVPKLSSRHVVVQSSTIDPASSRRFCERVRRTGARYVEAPFTGSKPAAEQRKTIFYVGGAPEDIAAAEPVLAKISQGRVRIGEPEQAAAFKLALNLIAANYAEALCESLNYARKAGITDEVYFNALRPTVAWSGFAALKEPKLKTHDYSTQFSVKHMLKDMRLVLGEGESALPLTRTLAECLKRAVDAGFAEEDFIALMKTLR